MKTLVVLAGLCIAYGFLHEILDFFHPGDPRMGIVVGDLAIMVAGGLALKSGIELRKLAERISRLEKAGSPLA